MVLSYTLPSGGKIRAWIACYDGNKPKNDISAAFKHSPAIYKPAGHGHPHSVTTEVEIPDGNLVGSDLQDNVYGERSSSDLE